MTPQTKKPQRPKKRETPNAIALLKVKDNGNGKNHSKVKDLRRSGSERLLSYSRAFAAVKYSKGKA